MTVLGVAILERAGESLGEGLPRFAAAFVLLLVGLLAARLLARLLSRGLAAAGLDEFSERAGVSDSLERFGIQRGLSKVVGRAVRIALSVVVVLASLSLLGLGFLQDSINQAVLFLPRALVALALLLAGAVVGTFVKGRVDRLATQMDLPAPLGRVAELVVFAVFAVTALTQVGVSTEILTLLVAIVLASAALAFSLAFGLGGREVARSMNAGRAIRSSHRIGQRIAVAGVRGQIVGMDASAITLETPTSTVRVPNHLVLESVVEIYEER